MRDGHLQCLTLPRLVVKGLDAYKSSGGICAGSVASVARLSVAVDSVGGGHAGMSGRRTG
jgi:hypothetical protein